MTSDQFQQGVVLTGARGDPELLCLRLVCEAKGVRYSWVEPGDREDPGVQGRRGDELWRGFPAVVGQLEAWRPVPELLPYNREHLDDVWDVVRRLRNELIPPVVRFLRSAGSSRTFAAKSEVERLFSLLENGLARAPFLSAGRLTLADLFAYPWVDKSFLAGGDPVPAAKFPRLTAWRQRLARERFISSSAEAFLKDLRP
jgi:glutathione S-transferase